MWRLHTRHSPHRCRCVLYHIPLYTLYSSDPYHNCKGIIYNAHRTKRKDPSLDHRVRCTSRDLASLYIYNPILLFTDIISWFGATVTSWQVDGKEKFFLSSKSALDAGKPVSGMDVAEVRSQTSFMGPRTDPLDPRWYPSRLRKFTQAGTVFHRYLIL